MEATVIKIDPLKILHTTDVARRTGYSRRKICELLALDRAAGTPGFNFPKPMRPVGNGKMEWREREVARWLEKRESDGM